MKYLLMNIRNKSFMKLLCNLIGNINNFPIFFTDEEMTWLEGLLVSEARHHHFYVELAQRYFDREVVQRRLHELALAEGEIVSVGSEEPRMHS